ncbi:unnamed protein product [Pieris macdunnoughi]|uniref:Uncharacterized protein n=1 Tax=Pieris macdunnoughi TaxID=345717 RepID=A0A821WAF6_9NEOP|nr:unnamed protein product [Pieris macdunnoughi]
MAEKDNTKVKDREFIENSSTIEADQVQTTSYAVPKTKDKKLKRKSEYELMQLAVNCLRQKPDEYENWAASCAADLKKMEPTQQIFAKSAIAAIIMEGQLGLLHRNSVEINTPTVTITPSPTYTRSTPTPTNYNSTPSPRYSELPPEELPHYQQNMDNSQQENDANDIATPKIVVRECDPLKNKISVKRPPKTSTERSRESRERKRALKKSYIISKPKPKTPAERSRDYRARKRARKNEDNHQSNDLTRITVEVEVDQEQENSQVEDFHFTNEKNKNFNRTLS